MKGGSIAYDATAGEWTSTGRHGTNPIRDPFEQADNASHRLVDVLSRAKRGAEKQFTVRHAVAFPDAQVTDSLGPAAPRELIIDARDLSKLTDRLTGVFDYWNRGRDVTAPSDDGVRMLEQVFAKSFDLRAPLVYELGAQDQELLRLTEEQFRVLDMLSRHPRAAICGCAGSGKTFLAAEKARQLAAQGFRVLVLCFNTLLALFFLWRFLQAGTEAQADVIFASCGCACELAPYSSGGRAGAPVPSCRASRRPM